MSAQGTPRQIAGTFFLLPALVLLGIALHDLWPRWPVWRHGSASPAVVVNIRVQVHSTAYKRGSTPEQKITKTLVVMPQGEGRVLERERMSDEQLAGLFPGKPVTLWRAAGSDFFLLEAEYQAGLAGFLLQPTFAIGAGLLLLSLGIFFIKRRRA